MATLEKAIAIAVRAHEGQVDKAGHPYVLHPLRVMLSLTSTEDRIVGVLHDVVEDCGITLDELRKDGFSEAVIQALDSVTKRPDEEGDEGYQSFVVRAGQNLIGRRVKIADLMDNMDLTRLDKLGDKDFRRLDRYLKALRYLEQVERQSS